MAMIDELLEMSDAQTPSSKSSGNKNMSEDVIDLGAAGTDGWGTSLANRIGGTGLKWHLQVNTALVGSSAAVICELKTHTATSMKSAGTTIIRHTIPAASAAGYRRSFGLPLQFSPNRYIATLYTISGAALTSGKFDSWLAPDTGDMPLS